MSASFWETCYGAGHQQRYPWDCVVSFVFRHLPRDRERREVRVLEVGCGTGANLWFAAREGCTVSGIDASPSAIENARERFQRDGLQGDLRVGSFLALPFEDDRFDLVIDRAALTCCPLPEIAQAIREIGRVSRVGGFLFFNPYADSHSSAASGVPKPGRVRHKIDAGTLAGMNQIAFLSRGDVEDLLCEAWHIRSMQRLELVDMTQAAAGIHAEWRVVAERGQRAAGSEARGPWQNSA